MRLSEQGAERQQGTRVWPVQFGAEYDFEDTTEPTRKYLICSTQRSGSHYVGHVLRSTGQLGCPLEYLSQKNFPIWSELSQSAGTDEPMSYIFSRRTGPNGVFGCKVQYTQLPNARRVLTDAELMRSYRFIFLTRRNVLAQAVSFARATQTDSWTSSMSTTAEARYDRALIATKLKQVVNNNARWLEFFHSFGLTFLPVEYEAFCADTAGEVRKIAEFLGIDPATLRLEQNVEFRRQGDSRNQEWVDRFIAESRESPELVSLHHFLPNPGDTGAQAGIRGAVRRWKATVGSWSGGR